MKPGIPWSVKGIDTEAREAAKHAARRSGMTLGEWLNTVIREQADEIEPQKPVQKPASRGAMGDIESKLDYLSEQLTRMARQDTTAGRFYERSRPAQDHSLADILTRLDASERQTAENFTRFSERIDTLGDKLSNEIGHFPQDPEDVPGYRSLETAVRNIVDHIEVSERKTRDTLKAVQERLNDVAYAATAPIDSDRLLADAPVISRLESRIADLAGRVTSPDGQEETRKLVQNEVGKLGSRIDQVKQSSEASAQRAQSQAVQQMQKDLRDFEGRMQSLFRDAEARRSDDGTIGHLRAEMESLGQRVDDLKAETASEHDLRSLRVVIEQLSARVAQGPDLRPLADLDRRLTEITKWLEQGRGDNVGSQIAELERRVYDLDNRIASSMRQDQGAPAWAGIEREFAGVTERLDRTEQQLQHIATLEQSIHQLYQSMEQSRNWSRDVAEDAANRMASRLMQDWSGNIAPAGPSAELQALENALATVRTNYEHADQRNQETLGAVHETLEQIINKLTELEQLRDQPAMPAAEAFVAPVMEPEPAAPEPQAWPDLKAETSYSNYQPIEPPPKQVEPVPPGIQDELIVAARRAAQAASQQTPGPSADGFLGRKRPAVQVQQPAPSRFSLRFRRRDKPLQTANLVADPSGPNVVTAPKAADAGKRRRLILIGLVLLAAASALAYNYVKKPQGNVSIAPPATQQVKPSAGGSSVFEKLTTTLAKSDAVLGNGSYASSLPNDSRTETIIATTNADVLPAGIGSPSLRQAALDGDAQAAFIVASRFAEGKAVPQDTAAAARWYQFAADKGLAPAQYRMGALLERGTGTKLDLAAALKWYERAATSGNVRAMHNAAVLLADGDKAKTTYQRAAHWFGEAAAHNLKDSQFNMALLYERGLGVEQDLGQALFWYSLAARQNDADAAAKAKTLESTLPKNTLAKVKSRLAGWAPTPDIAAANVVAIANPAWQDRPVAASATSEMPVLGSAVADTGPKSDLQEAQELLNRLGFDAGDANGAMGTRTRNSIRLFELQSGMRITGEVTPELMAKLRAKAG